MSTAETESDELLHKSEPIQNNELPLEIQVVQKGSENVDSDVDDADDDEYHDVEEGDGLWHVDVNVEIDKSPNGMNHVHVMKHISHHPINHDLDEEDPSDSDCDLSINLEDDLDVDGCFPGLDSAKGQAGQFMRRVWHASWKATHFYSLPEWLQDNDYLHTGHRPPLETFGACFRSIFRVHTETGNIWSHMLGCVAFMGVAAYFLTRPATEIQWQEKVVFSAFFAGAIMCLGLSFAFHTVYCHSERVGKLFSKLDYVGISLLIVGSFIPWLFYGFYCRGVSMIVYMSCIVGLGIGCMVVSLWDKFSEPEFRSVRAGTFIALGLSGVIPCIHYFIAEGFISAFYEASLGWLLLMAVLYIAGALLYAWRIPERYFPGKCDIWFQSHQIFHLFVVVAAFVHYHGISEMAVYRLTQGSCEEKQSPLYPHDEL